MANVLSRRPRVNAISIASHNDLSKMINEYAIGTEFKNVTSAIALGEIEELFHVKDVYLLYNNRLCVTHNMHNKIMYEFHGPPCAGHRGIQATLKGVDVYFYLPNMKKDITAYVSSCIGCKR